MKYAILFLLLAVALTGQAVVLQGFYWLLLWPALSFLVVAAAYWGLGPRVFGKRPDGTLAWYSSLLLLPYLVITWTAWHLVRTVSREEACNEAVPGLIVGRRLLGNEIPPGVSLVIDLTAEFPEPAAVRHSRAYLSVPMLDGAVPCEADFRRAVQAAVECPGVVYLHCAQGHGRTGLVAAAVLVAQGHSLTVDEALRVLRAKRPRLDLNHHQLRFLRQVCDRVADRSQQPG